MEGPAAHRRHSWLSSPTPADRAQRRVDVPLEPITSSPPGRRPTPRPADALAGTERAGATPRRHPASPSLGSPDSPDVPDVPDATELPGTSQRPRRRARRRVVLIVAAVAVGAIAVATVGSMVRDRSDGPASAFRRASLPVAADERWSVEVDAVAVRGAVAIGDVVILLTGGEPTLVALDRADGAERWRVRAGSSNELMSIAAVDGHVVTRSLLDSDDPPLVRVFEPSRGELRWTSAAGDGPVTVIDGALYRVTRQDVVGDRLDRLAVATGESVATTTFRGRDLIGGGHDRIVSLDDGRLRIVDLVELSPVVDGVVVGELGAAIDVDDAVVAVSEGELRLVRPDADGGATAGQVVATDVRALAGTARSSGVVVAVHGDGVRGWRVDADQLVEVWRADGDEARLVALEGADVVVAEGPAGGRALDAASGALLIDVGDPRSLEVAADGVLAAVLAPGPDTTWRAVEPDGATRWEAVLDDESTAVLVDDALVVVSSQLGAGRTSVMLLG